MDEFGKLFLRGRFAEEKDKFMRLMRILAIAGFLLAAAAAVLSWQTEKIPFWVCATFSVLSFAAEGAVNLLDLCKPRRLTALAAEQNSENGLWEEGEERARHEKVYRAYLDSFSGFGSGKRFWVLGIARLLAPALLSVTCLLVSAGIVVNEAALVSFTAMCILAGFAGIYDTLLESRARAKFYRLAQREIDEIKCEELHIAREKASKEASVARAGSSVPEQVELFLKDETELSDYRAMSRKSGMIGLALGVLYFAVIVLGMVAGNALERLGDEASWTIVLAVFAAIFVLSFASVYPISRAQKEIYARNFNKLGESETDRLRAELQQKWIKSQHAGNIMFACFTAGALGLGTALGLTAYFTGEEGMPLAQSLAVGILPVLVYAAIAALIVWFVMFAVAKRKMAPLQARLREMITSEKS